MHAPISGWILQVPFSIDAKRSHLMIKTTVSIGYFEKRDSATTWHARFSENFANIKRRNDEELDMQIGAQSIIEADPSIEIDIDPSDGSPEEAATNIDGVVIAIVESRFGGAYIDA